MLVFKPKTRSFTKSSSNYISLWKSTGIHNDESNDSTRLSTQSNLSGQLPSLLKENSIVSTSFNGNFLKQTKLDYNRSLVINIYIVYELKKRTIQNYDDNKNFVQVNGLFGNLKLAKTK